jgi:hypothetical protein
VIFSPTLDVDVARATMLSPLSVVVPVLDMDRADVDVVDCEIDDDVEM